MARNGDSAGKPWWTSPLIILVALLLMSSVGLTALGVASGDQSALDLVMTLVIVGLIVGGALFFPPFFESLYDVRFAVVLLDGWRQCGYGIKNPDADGYRDDDVVVDLQVFEERFKRIHVYEYIL